MSHIPVTLTEVRGGKARLRFTAEPSVRIMRTELIEGDANAAEHAKAG